VQSTTVSHVKDNPPSGGFSRFYDLPYKEFKMATIPDVLLTGTAYQNLYAATGIVVGTSVTVQNKTGSVLYLQNIAAQPSNTSKNGITLQPNEFIPVTGTIVGLWAKGSGSVSVEVIT
jgi:hypothetical protein